MAKTKKIKKSKKKEYSDWDDEWSEEEWKDWGERFGNRMNRWGERFGKRMSRRGKEFGEEVEGVADRFGCYCCRPFNILSVFGVLMGAIFGIIFLAIGAWVLGLIGHVVGSAFILGISNFFMSNLQWFLIASLFFGFVKYFSRMLRIRWLVWPITMSAGFLFAIWVILSILNQSGTLAATSILTSATSFFYSSLWDIFVALLVFGYVVVFFRMLFFRMIMRW